jgi:hypothetical protein
MYGSSKNLYFEIAVLRSEFATWGPLSMPGVSVGEDGPMKKNGRSISQPPHPRDNCLFAALPQEDAARLLPHLEPRTWALGDVLYDPDRAPAFLYFPTTAMVSLVYTLANGLTGEMGVVGREGVVGVALFMGGASTTSQALIQSAGSGFRLRADADRPDCRVQPAACNRTAVVPLAAADAGPSTARRSADDPRIHRPDVSSTPREYHARGSAPASGGCDSLYSGPHHDCGPSGPGSAGM